jgi:hypothetical protein
MNDIERRDGMLFLDVDVPDDIVRNWKRALRVLLTDVKFQRDCAAALDRFLDRHKGAPEIRFSYEDTDDVLVLLNVLNHALRAWAEAIDDTTSV